MRKKIILVQDDKRTELDGLYSEYTVGEMDFNNGGWTQQRYGNLILPRGVSIEEYDSVIIQEDKIIGSPQRVWDVKSIDSRFPKTVVTLEGAR